MSTLDLPANSFSKEFPRSLGRPANSALVNVGITTLAQLSKYSEKELLGIHGVGPKAVNILKEELAKKGLSLKP